MDCYMTEADTSFNPNPKHLFSTYVVYMLFLILPFFCSPREVKVEISP